MNTYIKTYQYGFGLAHGFGASTGGIGTYYGMYSYVFKGKHVMIPINTGT